MEPHVVPPGEGETDVPANRYSPDWFAAFGRPDGEATCHETRFLLGVLPPPPAAVLDVACGFGRHALALVEHGYGVTGLERDPEVAAAARTAGVDVRVLDVRRLGELDGCVDAVISMWASFGWFDDGENAAVLGAMAARLRPGGVLVLDVYDAAFFAPRQGTRANAGVIETTRVEGARLTTTLDYGGGRGDVFSWRLYSPEELRALGERAGLALDGVHAGYEPGAPPVGETPRMQAVFRRAAG